MQLRVRPHLLCPHSSLPHANIQFTLQLALPNQVQYAPASTIPFYIAIAVPRQDDLASQLVLPSNWTIDLIRCTLLGGTAARGLLTLFEADGSSVFVSSVAQGRIEVVEPGRDEDEGQWCLRGQLIVPRQAVQAFRFSMAAVYVRYFSNLL